MATQLDDALAKIGTEAQFTSHGLHIEVRIVGVKGAWGRICYRIEPVAGHGSTWIDEGSLGGTRPT